MYFQEKYGQLKTLNKKELSEICKNNNLKGYSKYNQKDLARFLADNLDLPTEEVLELVSCFWDDKLVSKIKDAEDYILRKDVVIEGFEDDLIKAKAGRYEVTIHNLGKKDFKYYC